MDIRFDRYLNNDELVEALRSLADARPGLARLESLGTSHEGNDIALLVITNEATGPDTDKPAFWLSGNIHAVEVAGSMACLHAAWRLVSEYGSDEYVTRLVDSTAFYVVPRQSPDGAARVFDTPQRLVLSGTRAYPFDDPATGLYAEDVDGDGRILDMRIPDPNGPFKVSDRDPRLMVRREADEFGGQYYQLLPEGRLPSYDGDLIRIARSREGLNYNRNFPANWGPETTESGAGPYPLSEPETAAVAKFIAAHPNIVAGMDYHTYSGIHLRPSCAAEDATMPLEDVWVWETMGKRATSFTGYPAVSVFHGFRYSPRKGMYGSFLDWLYEQRGIYGWTTELWDMCREAGIEREDFVAWHHDHPIDDDVALLRWNDEQLGGRGFVAWYEVDHPDLGRVELGGWDRVFVWNNPPVELLEAELAKNTPFVLFLAALAPRLEIRRAVVEPLGEEHWRVRLVVDNVGYLPTYGSRKGIELGVARPVRAVLSGADVLDGEPLRAVGHLEGRSSKAQFAGISPTASTDHRGVAAWVVRAPAGTSVTLEAFAERCGRTRTTAVLA